MGSSLTHMQNLGSLPPLDQGFILAWLFVSILLIIYQLFYKLPPKNSYFSQKIRQPPSLPYSLPFFGHALSIGRHGIDFLSKSYTKYGPIFRLKLFRFSLLVICDTSLASEYYKTEESVFSMFEFIQRISVLDTLLPNTDLTCFPNQIKATLAFKKDYFPRIEAEAKLLVERVKEVIKSGHEPDLVLEANRYVTRLSALSIGSLELGEEGVEAFSKFGKLVGNIVLASFVFPRWILRPFYTRRLNSHRRILENIVIPEILKYRADESKNQSAFFRVAVDYRREESGLPLSNHEISNIFIGFLFAAFGNTSLALNNSIIDLAMNSKYCEELKNELNELPKSTGTEDLYTIIRNSKYLKACILETVRTSPQAFSTGRSPYKKGATLGGYDVSGVDAIVLCPPLLQCQGPVAEKVFEAPGSYNPTRFLDKKDPQTPPYINSWGGGHHPCAGRVMSLMALQTALALFVKHIQVKVSETTKVVEDALSPMAFVEKRLIGVEYSILEDDS